MSQISLTSRKRGGGITKPNPFLQVQDLNREIPLQYCCSTVGSLPTHCCPQSKKEHGDLTQKTLLNVGLKIWRSQSISES